MELQINKIVILIQATLHTLSLLGRVGEGLHFSVAVTDDMDIPVDSSTTIFSSLLLSSELKGYIENPAYYLQDNPESTAALDLLMMTHGWRRYNIPEVIRGKPAYPSIAYQTSQQISGAVKNIVRSRPVVGSEVLILVNDSDFGLTSSDENGRFLFQDFEYPDSTAYFVRSLSNRGSDRVELVLDRKSFPNLIHALQSPVSEISTKEEEPKVESAPNAFITKAEQRVRYDEDMQVIHLSEVVVAAPKIERKEEPRLQYWANSSSDVTIRREDIEEVHYHYAAEYLTWVSAVEVNINQATGESSIRIRRGVNSISSDAAPLILIDGMPVEFYSPKYESLEAKYLTIPDFRITIFWKPNIVISESGEASFEFYTSDFPTTYSVVIEGLTNDGKIVRQIEKIQVK